MHSEVVVVFPPTQLMQRNTNELLFFCARIKIVKELIRGTCTLQDSQENKPKLSGSVTPLRVKIPPAGAERRRLTKMKKKTGLRAKNVPLHLTATASVTSFTCGEGPYSDGITGLNSRVA